MKIERSRHCLLFLVAAVVAAVGAVASPRANQGSMRLSTTAAGNIIVVTNTNDSGPGSLRDALAIANDGDTIDATAVSGTILLTSGQLNVDKDVTISGLGADDLAVDGNAQSLVFYINPFKTVTIDGLTITNGNGGIFNFDGALTLSNCIISGNSGGGISNFGFNGSSTLTVTNCTLSGNSANYGGGISNFGDNGGAELAVTNCTISDNSAEVSGGGIFSSAVGSAGGSSVVTVTNSTISGNSASDGGGIYNGAGHGHGAGLYITDSTLSGNSATGNGGGIYNYRQQGLSSATLELGGTILNAGSSGESIFNAGGTVTSHGYNLSSDNGGGYLTVTGDQIDTDPMLGLLQDNGGTTFTHALLPGSPAIDTGDPKFTPPPFYDQRGPGFDRVVNNRIDIGSFEVQGPTPTPTPSPTPAATPRPRPTPRLRPTPAPRS